MEIIDAGSISQTRIELFLKSKDPAAAERFMRLAADGDTDPSLCFLFVSEGREKGCLVLCMTKAGKASVGAALILIGDDYEKKRLLDHACTLLRERGAELITAEGDPEWFKSLGWRWTVDVGIIPPDIAEQSVRYWCKPLAEDVKPPLAPVDYPKAMELPAPDIKLGILGAAGEEKIGKMLYEVRERRRIAERVALIAFIAACAVIGVVYNGNKHTLWGVLLGTVFGLIMLYKNIFVPKGVVRETMEKRREKGCTGWIDYYGFGEKTIMHTDLKTAHGMIMSYEHIKIVYIKKDYIFLCDKIHGTYITGHYVMTGEGEAKQKLTALLREKATAADFKK